MDPISPALPRIDPPHNDPEGGAPAGPPPPRPSDLERAGRALANALYDALASGLGTNKPHDCADFTDAETHDFDRCVQAQVANPVLFMKEEADVNEVAPTDVKQRQVGDCALMATLIALTNTEEGRALLGHAIVENKNGKGEVTSYTVTLHEPQSHWFRPPTFTPVQITVDPPFALGHAAPVVENERAEVWPLVVEKAFAQYVGGYSKLNRGSTSDISMALLTGKPAESIPLGRYSSERLASDLAAGKLVVLETKGRFSHADIDDLYAKHAYSVTGAGTRDGKMFVTLRNPWGRDEGPIAYDDLNRWVSRVDVGSVK